MINVSGYLLVLLMFLLTAPSEAQPVTLELDAPRAKQVELFASFNQWQPVVMEKKPAGIWRLSLDLPPGRHEFVYKADNEWLPDADRSSISDGMGGYNSLIIIAK